MPLILLIIVMSLNIYYLKHIIAFLHTEKIKVFNNKIEIVRKIINNICIRQHMYTPSSSPTRYTSLQAHTGRHIGK